MMGAAIAVILVLVGVVAGAIINNRKDNADELGLIGPLASEASCGDTRTEDTTGTSEHVGPGTDTPDTTTVEY